MKKKSLLKSSNQSRSLTVKKKSSVAKANNFIKSFTIENFKSIRSLNLQPKRVNIFIGEPNSGKTNILEALSLLSDEFDPAIFFPEIFRVNSLKEIFHLQKTASDISVRTDQLNCQIQYSKTGIGVKKSLFKYTLRHQLSKQFITIDFATPMQIESSGDGGSSDNKRLSTHIRFYKYEARLKYDSNSYSILQSPYGMNIIDCLISNEELRESINLILKNEGLKLKVDPENYNLDVLMGSDDNVVFTYSYNSLSETLRRHIFLEAILHTNKNSVLLLDEPDTHAFPAYVKQFAEQVAYDENNQYFITTHNPYLLGSVLEKTPLKDLNIYVCRRNKGQTQPVLLNKKQVDELIEIGIESSFFNLDDFYPANEKEKE